MDSVLLQLDNHPAERDLIGKIVLAYGVLEVALLELAASALNGEIDIATRTIFRLKSESNRLEVADALIRPRFSAHGLGPAWHDAYGAMKFCKRVRNAYAHSQWISDEHGVLRFGDMDMAAKSHGEKCQVAMRPLTRSVLESQFAYFTYTDHLLLWANDQYQLKTGLPRKLTADQHVTRPRRIPLPKLDSRGEARTHRSSSRGG